MRVFSLVALLVLVGAYLYSLRSGRAPGAPPIAWGPLAPEDQASPLWLPVRRLENGIAEEPLYEIPEARVSAGEATLLMSLEVLDRIDAYYELVVQDFARNALWRDEIPEEHTNAGRLVLRLATARLEPGLYWIEIIENESGGFSSTKAESAFRILE